jgi:hypothetical protein
MIDANDWLCTFHQPGKHGFAIVLPGSIRCISFPASFLEEHGHELQHVRDLLRPWVGVGFYKLHIKGRRGWRPQYYRETGKGTWTTWDPTTEGWDGKPMKKKRMYL